MSGFDGFNTDFFQSSYSIEEQGQPYDYSGRPYSKPYGGYEYPPQAGFVPPDMMQQQQPYTGQIYQPTQGYTPASAQSFYGSNFEDEPPLLEELGINFDHIWQKTLTVLHPLKVADGTIMNETDLAGPMVFCLAFGATLLLVWAWGQESSSFSWSVLSGKGPPGIIRVQLLSLHSTKGMDELCHTSPWNVVKGSGLSLAQRLQQV